MYVNGFRKANYPRQSIHIQRIGLSKQHNLDGKSPSFDNKGTNHEETKVERGKLSRILLGPLNFFYLFMETSSIHGFNHLTTKKRHVFEYKPEYSALMLFLWGIIKIVYTAQLLIYIFKTCILWLGALISGVYGFLTISLSTLDRYTNNPTVVSLERNYKDWNTTLPAATVCPDNKYDDDNLESVLNRLKITDEDAKEEAKDFLEKLAKSNYSAFDILPNFKAISPREYLDAIVDMRYEFEYSVSNSNIDNIELQENELMLNVNEMSLCYSYNSQIAVYLNPMFWKTGNYTHSSTSFQMVGSPLDGDIFTQVMNMDTGYTVYLHSPQEVPDIASKGGRAYQGSYKAQDVVALSIVSAPEIRSLTIPQRGCRFIEESNLELSPVYSYNLCRMECRMKLALQLCDCVPYFYKPLDVYRTCDVEGMKCLSEHADVLIKLVRSTEKIDCKCLPPCDDVNFVIETENIMDWTLGTNLKWGLVKYPRQRLRRDVLFGVADVLVNLGGTAGLFFGCSVLSLVEILYFFTLRLLWFVLKRN